MFKKLWNSLKKLFTTITGGTFVMLLAATVLLWIFVEIKAFSGWLFWIIGIIWSIFILGMIIYKIYDKFKN